MIAHDAPHRAAGQAGRLEATSEVRCDFAAEIIRI